MIDADIPHIENSFILIFYSVGLYMKKQNKININKYLRAIDKIEKARKQNNVNWMDVLRIALRHAPKETIILMNKINKKDQIITNLFKRAK